MNKHIVSVICGCLLYVTGIAQNDSFENTLNVIEQNNKELQAFKKFIESKSLTFSSENNLPNPEVSAYYLPFGSANNTSNYSEFEVSQSIEFPTVYGARRQWNVLKTEQLNEEYKLLRQRVLLRASKQVNKLISFEKQHAIEIERHEQSEQVYNQMKELFKKEQVGVLELNKAKIAWMQLKFHVEQIETKKVTVLKQLTSLNGGMSLDFETASFVEDKPMDSFDTLWNDHINKDPSLIKLKLNEAASLQQLKVEKNKSLPNLTLGYNNQGVSGTRVSGFLGGVSIPIWNNKNKVKAARSNHEYQVINSQAQFVSKEATYFEQFNTYQILYKKFHEYKQTLVSLNGDELLFKAYMLGEYSFMEYYMELEFYHNAYDDMLLMELELQQLKTELLKHNL